MSFYKIFSKDFRFFFNLYLVKICMSAMNHIVLQTPGRVWISCFQDIYLLHTPVGSPWFSHFSMIVAGCLDPRQEYIQYNPGFTFIVVAYVASCILHHFLYFLIRYYFYWFFLSNHKRGDIYSAGRLSYAHFQLSSCS